MSWLPFLDAQICPELFIDDDYRLSLDGKGQPAISIEANPINYFARHDLKAILDEASAPVYISMYAPGAFCLYPASNDISQLFEKNSAHSYGLMSPLRGNMRAPLPVGVLRLSKDQSLAPLPRAREWYQIGAQAMVEKHFGVIEYYAKEAERTWPSLAEKNVPPTPNKTKTLTNPSTTTNELGPFLEWLKTDLLGDAGLHDSIVDSLRFNKQNDLDALAWYRERDQNIYYSQDLVDHLNQGHYELIGSALRHEWVHWQSNLMSVITPVDVLVSAGVSVFSSTLPLSLPPWDAGRLVNTLRPIDCSAETMSYLVQADADEHLPQDLKTRVGQWMAGSELRLAESAQKKASPSNLWALAYDHLHRGLVKFIGSDYVNRNTKIIRAHYGQCTGN